MKLAVSGDTVSPKAVRDEQRKKSGVNILHLDIPQDLDGQGYKCSSILAIHYQVFSEWPEG